MKETVLPIERKRGVPSEPATNYKSTVSINYELGTISDLQFVDESINAKTSDDLVVDAIEERERREQKCETDRQSQLQPHVMPKVDESIVGFNIEYCFEYYYLCFHEDARVLKVYGLFSIIDLYL